LLYNNQSFLIPLIVFLFLYLFISYHLISHYPTLPHLLQVPPAAVAFSTPHSSEKYNGEAPSSLDSINSQGHGGDRERERMREGFSCSSPNMTHSVDEEGKFEGKGELKGELKGDGKGEGKGEKGPKEKEKDLQGAISNALSNNTGINGKHHSAISETFITQLFIPSN
jgi:hypothetical protein